MRRDSGDTASRKSVTSGAAGTATGRALLELKQARGVLSGEDYPEFRTPQDTKDWVNELRRESDRRLEIG